MSNEKATATKCPRCEYPKENYQHCGQCGLKPHYSKDGRRQLCFKCNRYCAHSCRFCPYCDK